MGESGGPEHFRAVHARSGAVMAAIDEPNVGPPRFIIADITCDERWLSIDQSEALSLDRWR